MDIIREDCIYARQSVDRKDSISIESQIDFCKYELKGGSCRVFKDKQTGRSFKSYWERSARERCGGSSCTSWTGSAAPFWTLRT